MSLSSERSDARPAPRADEETPAPAADRRPARRSAAPRKVVRGLLGVLALCAVLEAVSRAGIVRPEFLPPFSTVLWNAVLVWGQEEFRADVLSTLLSYLVGMLIAIGIAVPVGIVFGLFEPVYRASRAVVELIRPIPPIALIPLLILLLGTGFEMKLVVVVFATIWPILFNTMYGVHDVDPLAKEMARSFGISRGGVVRRVVIPAAAPFIATGIRISSSIALIVVITVELIAGGAEGVGAFIARSRAAGTEVEDVYAGTLIAGFLGLVINLVLGGAERRWFAWQTTTKEG
jgi:NitT/TauT family transport system permease protein